MIRQGDVLLVPVEGFLESARRIEPEHGRVILAHGEATGHAHAVSAAHAALYRLGRGHFLKVHEATPLMHEEHAHIDLAPGVYQVVRQREYSPGEIRIVRD